MGKKGFTVWIGSHRRLLLWSAAFLVAAICLLGYKLGSLTEGLSHSELKTATTPVGWHGIYSQPLGLPLKILRSVLFFLFPAHGQALVRLPNVMLGIAAIASFGGLIRLWHGRRTAVLATALFTSGAWTLHTSRLATMDTLYLWALPSLLYSHFLVRKYRSRSFVPLLNIIVWGLLLYIPGLVWFVLIDIYLQRQYILQIWRITRSLTRRALYVVSGLIWLPLLVIDLFRPDELLVWLGFPARLPELATVSKHFAAVPVHLLVRGPEYPDQWLGKAPVLDAFTLVMCLLGFYFYARHWSAARTRQLEIYAALGAILVGLSGPVTLSLLVPLLYMSAATGIAYLLHVWFKTFPLNPIARNFAVTLVVAAVLLSGVYNCRAYFVAWPHTQATRAAFQYHERP